MKVSRNWSLMESKEQQWRYWLLMLFCITWFAKSHAQHSENNNSIVYHLKQITDPGKYDTSHFYEAIRLIYRYKEGDLLNNKAILDEISRLEPVLKKEDYISLEAAVFLSQLQPGKGATVDLIRYGKNFIKAHKNSLTDSNSRFMFLNVLRELRMPFRNSDSIYAGITFYNELNREFQQVNDSDIVSICYNVLAGIYYRLGLIDNAKYNMLKSIDYLSDAQLEPGVTSIQSVLGKAGKANRYSVLGSFQINDDKPALAEKYLRLGINNYEQLKEPLLFADGPYIYLQMAICKSELNSDSSGYYFDKVFELLNQYRNTPFGSVYYYFHKGAYFFKNNILDSAAYYIRKSILLKDSSQAPLVSAWGELFPNYYLAAIDLKMGKPKAAIPLLLAEINDLKLFNTRRLIIREKKLLAEAYHAAGLDKESQAEITEVLKIVEDLDAEKDAAKSVSFEIEKKMQADDLNIAQLKAQDESSRKARYYLYGLSALLGLFAITLVLAIVNKQKSNNRLTDKNHEISSTLEKLKQAQAQLIHSEKMASLGELTAGIAHEIQNPLNFVNNFSEVNVELIDELEREISGGNLNEVRSLAHDIRVNEQKINHHGKRADAIVKGMLQHSRGSMGEKTTTDINSLVNEYLRIAYHGYLSKENDLSVVIKKDLDDTMPGISAIPQEIGRVLINLFNNAFFAVQERSKKPGMNSSDFEPAVSVSTRLTGSMAVITIEDSGGGIPDTVLAKIFQPFYTTKPAGQGTGLGLSLSYDIIKAHGGRIEVQTREGFGTKFIIYLPA